MIIKEFRVVLPLSVEEYQIGQLWSVAEASKQETGGGEGVEVLENRKFNGVDLYGGKYTTGQFTHKIYHVQSKFPAWLQKIVPKGMLSIHEKAWNAYPYCKTELSKPNYKDFFIRIETIHLPDRGTTENAHNLSSEILEQREVVQINIANDQEFLNTSDLRPETTPSIFLSEKTKRGCLIGNWQETCEPYMCAYKLVTVNFKWFGVQNIVENFVQKQYPRLFSKFHRELFCWIDQWYDLTLADIRKIEEEVQRELDEARKKGSLRGMVA